ncbi:alpha/beta fold hydrolase [Saccharopolyspora indica]|uniref:alpha/beta fold hydrolase n=1 Tax=Saccharopolyspora indica TaxID=1229659 RepID=UPI0022EB00EE|nr:alpha/beta fold hydrolase [Saccharopolyspora indica]MDA3646225.1 alpha/beta fold hydrolase [Saccharopolyspora indica]
MTTTTSAVAHPGGDRLGRRELTRVPLVVDGVAPVDLTAKPPPGRHLEVATGQGPVRLHVRETPAPSATAETAVHLHGLAGSATNWTDLAAVLAPRLRSIAVDLPGFGRTEPPPGFTCTRRANAEVVIGLLAQLPGPVHLTGNSFGAAVAIEVAVQRPDLVATLTLISPAMPDLRLDPRRLSDPRIALAMVPVLGTRARRQLATTTPAERTEQLLRLCFADPDVVPEHRFAEAVAEFEERDGLPWAGPALGRTTMELLRSWLVPPARSLWRLLPEISAPTLVVWGAQDRVVSVRKAPRTALLVPRGKLLVLPRTGHVAQMERPRIVARAVLGLAGSEDGW